MTFGLSKPKIVDKPWGRELWFAHTDKYAGKVLEVNAGMKLSLQYHEKKKESMYVLEGKMIMTDGTDKVEMNEGDCITLEPRQVHRIDAITDVRVFEVSTPELDDVVRVEDYYKRQE